MVRVTRIGVLGTTLANTSNRRTLRGNNSDYFVFLRSVCQLLVTANITTSSPIPTLMMEALCSYDNSVLTTATCRHIPEAGILHSHDREEL
jgi:hypothetical protein